MKHANRQLPWILSAVATAALGGCGGVQVAADAEFPKPLIQPLPINMGIYYSDEFRKYRHEEQRWGVDWKVDLGAYHVKMANQLFAAAFSTVTMLKEAKAPESDVRAVLEPRIEQYSFITPRDTGAKYFAVTIRYRLNVFAPDGRLADSLTFTGYGSSRSSGVTSTNPMIIATKAAMRDAAAKFLVQFPDQDIAKKLVNAGTPLIEERPEQPAVAEGSPAPASETPEMETVPIVDSAPPAGVPAPPAPPEGGEKPTEQPPNQDQPAGTSTTQSTPGSPDRSNLRTRN